MATVLTSLGISDEEVAVYDWRRERFEELIPNARPEDVEELVNSRHVSPNDLERIINKGCNPELAIKIVL